MPTLAPPVPKSMPRRYGPSAIPPPSRAHPTCNDGLIILPAELLPQVGRDEVIYPLEDVIRQVLLGFLLQLLGGGLAGQDDGRGHPGVEAMRISV